MYTPKRYGESRIDACPFCEKTCVAKNSQGIPVCQAHKESELANLKCICGEWLDIKQGKWGPYFNCMRCGNVSFRRGIEANPQIKEKVKCIVQKANENKKIS